MKKSIILFCLFASVAAQAQYDTLPYNIGIPNYFTSHTFDSIHVIQHDNRLCIPQPSTLISFIVVNENANDHHHMYIPADIPYAADGDIAWGFYPDSAIHVIGVAWYNRIDNFNWNMYWDTFDVKLFHPIGNHMAPIVKKRITHDTFSFSKVLDLGRGWDESDITQWSVFNIPAPLYEVYFDNEIDISDSLYLSVKFTWSPDGWPKNLDATAGWREAHNPGIPGSNPLIYPIQSYRKKDTPGDDDPWTYGEIHAYPLLFPIIRLEGDTCPEVNNVNFIKAGNTAAIAMWDEGTNHRDWQLYIGPQGSLPNDEEAVTERVPRHLLNNLSPTAHYDVFVRARCMFARDMWSSWTGPIDLCVSTIGIDGADAVDWALTPNPTHGSVTVQCEEGIRSVELLTVKGERILYQDKSGEQTCTLDLGGLVKGLYIVQITTAQGTAVRKLAVE